MSNDLDLVDNHWRSAQSKRPSRKRSATQACGRITGPDRYKQLADQFAETACNDAFSVVVVSIGLVPVSDAPLQQALSHIDEQAPTARVVSDRRYLSESSMVLLDQPTTDPKEMATPALLTA